MTISLNPTARITSNFWDEHGNCTPNVDLTGEILALPYEEVKGLALKGNSGWDADVTRTLAYLARVGYCKPSGHFGLPEVRVAIQDFFQVNDGSDLTAEAFEAAKVQFARLLPREVSVDIRVQMKLRVSGEVDMDEVINEMDYDLKSQTSCAVVVSSEIVESEIR